MRRKVSGLEDRVTHEEGEGHRQGLEEVAGRLSHSLNNILVGVLGPAELLKLSLPDDSFQAHYRLEQIISSGWRAMHLVGRFHQSVYGLAQGETGPVEITQIAHTIYSSFRDELQARNIAFEVSIEPAELEVEATEEGLYEILGNLVSNAMDAMPEGGRIRLSANTLGEDVELEVSDTGVGMSVETIQRIFDPFFTTRAHVGAGLGLSIVSSTLERWGGSIAVESTPGTGTLVTIVIPGPGHQGRKNGRA